MKECYVIKEFRAIADLVWDLDASESWWITRINVPRQFRGRGIGSKLLHIILKDADKENWQLRLMIEASDGLTTKQLRFWYERNGFKRINSGKRRGIFIRNPQSKENKK